MFTQGQDVRIVSYKIPGSKFNPVGLYGQVLVDEGTYEYIPVRLENGEISMFEADELRPKETIN